MIAIHAALGVATTALFAAAAALGAWRWWRAQPSPAFWGVLRTAQAALLLETLNGGLLLALGGEARDDLHLLYGLLPLGVSFAAEQLRVSAAETVLEARGYESAQEVGALPVREQRAVVIAVVRREIGVMAVAAAIAFALSLRAAFTA